VSRLVRLLAVGAVPLAAVLVVLAVDTFRVTAALERDDVRFDAAPRRQGGLWEEAGLLPGGTARSLLQVEDDVSYRRTVASFLRVAPGRDVFFAPELENLRGRVQLELAELGATDANPARRAQALNLLAAILLEKVPPDPVERENVLRRAIDLLRSAIKADPGNAEAKLNLELALRTAKASAITGVDPESGASKGSISGQGRSGSGY